MEKELEKDWVLSGGGMQGEIYSHKSDPTIVLKLYFDYFAEEYIDNEIALNEAAIGAGINCPKAVEKVRFGNRVGVVYTKILNKKSFCRLAGENTEMIDGLASRMASMVKELHSRSAKGTPIPSAYDFFKDAIETDKYADDKMKSLAYKALEEVSKDACDTIVHGDFHFGNIVTDGKTDYFIDLGNLAFGHPNFDISMFYLVTHYGHPQLAKDVFHMSIPQVELFWNAFKKYYYGREVSDEELLPSLINYLILRVMWIQTDTDNAPFCQPLFQLLVSGACPVFDRTL